VVLLSTGTGEAPHNYLSWQLLSQGHTGKILSACCVRFKRDLGYLDIQDKLMARYPNYKYLSLTTREKDTIGHKVYIQISCRAASSKPNWGRHSIRRRPMCIYAAIPT